MLGGFALAGTAVFSGDAYLNDTDMKRPPARKDGKILVDLHAHIDRNVKKQYY